MPGSGPRRWRGHCGIAEPATTAPYGAWPSPLDAATVTRGRLRIGDLQCDGNDVYWVEGRPAEAGRCVVVRHRDGRCEDVLPAPYSARNQVHEYGGGALLARAGRVFFCNAADRRIHVIEADGGLRPITPELGDVRFADLELDAARERLFAVLEDHRGGSVENCIASVDVRSGQVTPVVAGNDFYSTPRLSPDARTLAWLTWNHPQMPFDGTELWRADVDGDSVRDAHRVCGSPDEAIFQPAWSPQGVLHLVSDASGWWNLYRVEAGALVPLAPMAADCGRAAWVFRLATYAFLGAGRIALCASLGGHWELHLVEDGSVRPLPLQDITDIDGHIDASGDDLVLLAGGPRQASSVVRVSTRSRQLDVLRCSSDVEIADELVSPAQPLTFPGHENAPAHAYWYAPRNPGVAAPPDTLPPLLVRAHGGPTSATSSALDPQIQYWTSRGFAYVDVDYGGSTGYGRDYRRRLTLQEGVVDVGDCIAAARHLAAEGRVDGARLFIHGSSAGGYIVLCAMAFHDLFAAGCSLYGIADLELLMQDSHKFEARYFDSMVGPWPAARERYRERSPIHAIDRVRRPVLLLQGLEDPVVPPNQAEAMFAALRDAGVPCALIGFEGEQHGFRRAETLVRALQAQLAFFCRVCGIPAEPGLPPLRIANLD